MPESAERFPRTANPAKDTMFSRPTVKTITPVLLNICAFLMAFCSLSYELLIAARLSRLLGEGLFVYPACVAIFILFMGIGGTIWYRTQVAAPTALNGLLSLEMGLTFLGAFSILIINASLFDSLYSINVEAIIMGAVMAVMIGFFSGQELPLLFHLCAPLNLPPKQIRRIIFFDYLASFAASLACSAWLFHALGYFKTSILVSAVNFLVVLLLFVLGRQNGLPVRWWNFPLIAILCAGFITALPQIDAYENRLIQRIYLSNRPAVLLAKKSTPYQEVLLFAMNKDGRVKTVQADDVLRRPKDYYLLTVINGSLQFFDPLDQTYDPDHLFLFEPFVTLLPKVEKVLILGGGDGLLTRQAVKYPYIRDITVVDIDKAWVHFARTNPFLKMNNQGSLDDPRVRIFYKDAFEWVLTARDRYDLIIVDFPAEPASLAKIRTTSVQFFRDLGRLLTPDGVAVVRSNTLSSLLKQRLYTSTALKAGLFPLLGQKAGTSTWSAVEHIVLFKTEGRRETFLEQYPQYVYYRHRQPLRPKVGFVNYFKGTPGTEWISFYDPLVSRLPLPEKKQLLKETW